MLAEIDRVLAPNGEAYLTFKAKQHLATLEATEKRLNENLVIPTEGPEAGIPHCLLDESEIRSLLARFELVRFSLIEDIWTRGRGWHYFVLAKKT